MKLNNNIVELAIMQAESLQCTPMMERFFGRITKFFKRVITFRFICPEEIRGNSIHRDWLKGLRSDQIYGLLLSVRITQVENLFPQSHGRGCMALLRRKKAKRVFWFDSDGDLQTLLGELKFC